MAGEAYGLVGTSSLGEEGLARVREVLAEQLAAAGADDQEIERQLAEADVLGEAWHMWLRNIFLMATASDLPELTDAPVAQLQESVQQGYELAARGIRQIIEATIELERRDIQPWNPSW